MQKGFFPSSGVLALRKNTLGCCTTGLAMRALYWFNGDLDQTQLDCMTNAFINHSWCLPNGVMASALNTLCNYWPTYLRFALPTLGLAGLRLVRVFGKRPPVALPFLQQSPYRRT